MKICLECEGITDTAQERCASCGVPLTDTSAVHFPLRRGEAEAANPLLGALVDGKYLVQSVLGKGGMGTVFRAMHQVSLVPVALKILNPRFAARAEYRESFLAEAQKAGRVVHEHAGRILDVGEAEDGTVYIAMEEVSGVTLHECVYGDAPLAPSVVVDILEQICEALAAAHHAGLVHRDLSPRNVMVVERHGRPFVKILDFGIAKGLPHPAAALHHLDVPGAPGGFASPPYSAPEHLEGKDVDPRSDLYSLGVLAYEALSRRLPVRGANSQELAEATVRGEVEPLPAPPGTPVPLQRLVRRLLAHEPEDRPSSADEVLWELRALSRPGPRAVRDVAVLVFLLAVAVCAFAYSGQEEPRLVPHPGPLLVGTNVAGLVEQELPAARLARVRFDHMGFAAADLHGEVSRGGDRLFAAPLGAQVVDGALVLDRDTSPVYASFLSRLERHCRDGGGVVVTFAPWRGPMLGAARVFVDDVLPALTLSHDLSQGRRSGVLDAESWMVVDCVDSGSLEEFVLQASVDGEELLRVDLLAADSDYLTRHPSRRVRARTLLKGLQDPDSAVAVTGVELQLTARDRAGNQATPKNLQVDVDFVVSRIVGPGDVTATLLDQTAQLQLELSAADPEELDVAVRMPAEAQPRWRDVQARRSGTLLEIDLPKPAEPRPQPAPIEVRVTDPSGNSADFAGRVTYYTREARLALDAAPALDAVLRPLGTGLVWTGEVVEFGFRCNDFYKPVAVRCTPELEVTLMDAEHGSGRLRLGPRAGRSEDARLLIELEPNTLRPSSVEEAWPLRIQTDRLRLDLPGAAGVRFARGIEGESALFRRAADGTFEQNANWSLVPPDARLLRGAVLWGDGDADTATRFPLPECARPTGAFVRGHPPRPGANAVHLELKDVFGRPVDVAARGGTPLSRVATGPLRGAVCIARFQFQKEVARPQSDPLRLEFQRPTRLILHSDYVFAPRDREQISLLFQANPVPCAELRSRPGGTDLVFDLGFTEMALAAGRAPAAPELQTEGLRFGINVTLRTPAGEQSFRDGSRIPVETVRSSLRQVRIGERAPGVDPILAAIEMVPVLRPLRAYPDPVPAAMRRGGGFLRQREIGVQSVRDCYLQQRELTCAQYDALVRGHLALPAALRPDPTRLLFPRDPAGAKRLTAGGLRPHTVPAPEWAQHVRAHGARPVTGIDFYQAFAVARIAGVLLFGDPAAFRLPFGVELETAALGESAPGVLNGVAGRRIVDLRREDRVDTDRGAFFGLDFGVREWVMDLPWPVGGSEDQQETVAGWLASHERHVEYAMGRQEMTASLRAVLQDAGVVRGMSLDALDALRDLSTGAMATATGPLAAGVPGVVRATHVQRGGQGLLLDEPHHLLPRIGMRLAGGRAFVARMRAR